MYTSVTDLAGGLVSSGNNDVRTASMSFADPDSSVQSTPLELKDDLLVLLADRTFGSMSGRPIGHYVMSWLERTTLSRLVMSTALTTYSRGAVSS